jgi:hypothetical protein
MLPDKKIIAFDLDGTLTVSKSSITKQMVELMRCLLEKKMVAVITGGQFKQFQAQFLPSLLLHPSVQSGLKNLFILPTSGSQRYEYDSVQGSWHLADQEPFLEELKQKVKTLLNAMVQSGKYDFAKNPRGELIEDRGTQISLSALGQLAPIAEKEVWDPDQQKRQRMKAELEPELPEVTISIGGTTTLDFLPKGFTKAVGLARLLDKLGLQKSDMLFVGDGLFPGGNDYSVKEAGFETISVKNPEETEEIIKKWIS